MLSYFGGGFHCANVCVGGGGGGGGEEGGLYDSLITDLDPTCARG